MDHPGRHGLWVGLGGISVQEPTKKTKYKYETKEIGLAAAKKRKNRGRKDQHRRAKQYWTATQKEKVPQK